MPTTRSRTTTKLLRLFPEELAHITARAQAYGLTPARFIREAALGPTPKTWNHREADRLVRALARIGRSLEHVARLTRPGLSGALAKHLATARAEHDALVRQLMLNGGQGTRRSPQ
jgi:mobilization protein NikA